MMRSHFCKYLAGALCLVAGHAYGLESTASGSTTQTELVGIMQRLEATRAALETTINQILTCNNKNMIFASDSSAPGRDAQGCVNANAEIETTKYEVVREEKHVDLPGTCKGSGKNGQCSVSVNLGQFKGKENVRLGASCSPAGWCKDAAYGLVALPSLTGSFTGLTIVKASGSKANGVKVQSYDPNSGVAELRSFYSGKDTDHEYGGISRIGVDYTVMSLKEVPPVK